MTSNLFQEGEKDADKLKEHVRILQEENFTRIAQIADLQVEINSLKVIFFVLGWCHENFSNVATVRTRK
jgi:hypothetical protein